MQETVFDLCWQSKASRSVQQGAATAQPGALWMTIAEYFFIEKRDQSHET